MKTRIVLLLSVVMFTFACKHTKSTEKTTGPAAPTTYRAIVSFGSSGSGIDSKTVASLESYIINFGKAEGKTISYDKVPYGKEGEIDYCFPLTELSKGKQGDFVNGLNNVIKSAKLVTVKENAVCAHKK
ncbi:MAG: hypothetical protein ABR968_06680 [Bacteroidales bacterium]|jgi:hypothetical protein